ncbi:MAG: ferrous iron transport protein A [Ruminococcaceae bacterium]|nr:ferrous iron transport protein A [Oscillospiraceae bacterium]
MLTAMSELRKGESGIIKSIEHVGNMRRRLIDIGFNVGERVTLLAHAPLGEPSAFYIKGSVIALRRNDASLITVITEEEDGTDPKKRRQGNS